MSERLQLTAGETTLSRQTAVHETVRSCDGSDLGSRVVSRLELAAATFSRAKESVG